MKKKFKLPKKIRLVYDSAVSEGENNGESTFFSMKSRSPFLDYARQTCAAINSRYNDHDDLVNALRESTAQLKEFRKYASEMRNQVMLNMQAAEKHGFKYIDLDSLDEVSVQVFKNQRLISKMEETP